MTDGYKIKRVLIWQGGVEKQIYPAGWKPGANTLAYRPLSSDLKEASGKSGLDRTISSGTVSYSNNMATVTRLTISTSLINGYGGDFTILGYTQLSNDNTGFSPAINSSGYPNAANGLINNKAACRININSNWYGPEVSYTTQGVHLYAGVKTGTDIIVYVDGIEIGRTTGTYGTSYGANHNNMWLGRNVAGSGTATRGGLIVESKAWTQDEIQLYYLQTKSNYGL